MGDTVPIFPLSHVLLPGMPLPLHIFERRYRQLLADIAAGQQGKAFGVVALHKGTETSTSSDFARIGTMAEIVEQEPYPDGSCDLLTVGSRRFEIVDVDRTGKPYLQAVVTWLDEDDGDLVPGLIDASRGLCDTYGRVLAALSGRAHDGDLTGDAMRLSYEIAARLQLTVDDRQELLAAPTAAARLGGCLRLMRREIILLRQTRTVPIASQALRIAPSSS